MELMTIDGDQFTQKRLASNLKTTLERIEKRRLSGSTGGKAKSLNEKERELASATGLLQQNPTYAPETKTRTVEEEKKDAPPAPLFEKTEDAELFDRGKVVLGKEAGGLIARLLKSKKGNVALARAAIEQASTKENPREYIGAILRGPADVRHTAQDKFAGII
jgi:hypothetical protein